MLLLRSWLHLYLRCWASLALQFLATHQLLSGWLSRVVQAHHMGLSCLTQKEVFLFRILPSPSYLQVTHGESRAFIVGDLCPSGCASDPVGPLCRGCAVREIDSHLQSRQRLGRQVISVQLRFHGEACSQISCPEHLQIPTCACPTASSGTD